MTREPIERRHSRATGATRPDVGSPVGAARGSGGSNSRNLGSIPFTLVRVVDPAGSHALRLRPAASPLRHDSRPAHLLFNFAAWNLFLSPPRVAPRAGQERTEADVSASQPSRRSRHTASFLARFRFI